MIPKENILETLYLYRVSFVIIIFTSLKGESWNGNKNTIFIRTILDKESAILFQNAFPILEKYINHVHTYHGAPAKVGSILKNEIFNNFKRLLKLHNRGINVFFTDIDRIKEIMLKEIDKN